jgi:hypothetical protein
MELIVIAFAAAWTYIYVKQTALITFYEGDKKLRARFDASGDEAARKLMREAGYDA